MKDSSKKQIMEQYSQIEEAYFKTSYLKKQPYHKNDEER